MCALTFKEVASSINYEFLFDLLVDAIGLFLRVLQRLDERLGEGD